MKRKNIVLVAGVFPPGIGGMQQYYYNLSKHSKHNLTVLAPHYPKDEAFDAGLPFKIIRGAFMRNESVDATRWPKLFRYVRRTVRQEKADLTIYGYILIGLIGLILNLFTKHKYVISTHGMDMLQFRHVWGLNKLVSLILRRAEGVLTNSVFTTKLVLDYGVDPSRIEMVHPGVEDIYCRQARDEALIQRHGLEGKYVLLTVGRLVRRKGHDKVIEAMPEILKRIPHAIYLIVGDGPERKRLEQLARDCGVAEHVRFAGYAPDLKALNAYYNSCDQFIMVSRELESGDAEGFGIVYLEAAMTGIPVIAGRSGGVSEAVLDGETGLLVDPQSTAEIAGAVVRLQQDHRLRAELARRGGERARGQFRYERLAERFDRALSRISAPRTARRAAAVPAAARAAARSGGKPVPGAGDGTGSAR